ncbi:putative 3-mercaptopyruvate sulfurtransferase [Litchfieldella qijiaojingensis]|uniref:3-mercaptopyruvate sulfurtransferase n=1 Tax=Litchfieldella qijiaojingensis TaxID=980347 RepID=A0ABQ2YGW1_9GAMM|nr:sulfurtransferase [Halomonas qijiaojingensis]GGX81253.1 putative 3-mercaptopyruvate sulfurtransferase [Halomonas qijiaojingensis]
MSDSLITAPELQAWLITATPITILDCRARLGDLSAGESLWRDGHIPGSRHLDLDRDLAAAPGEGGRHPLPSQAAFTATLQRLGITPQMPVVVYDDMGGQLAAARAWWMLHCWARHPQVRVLDGGLPAWQALGERLETGEEEKRLPSTWQPDYDEAAVTDAEEVAVTSALKLDARAWPRFRGESEPIDPVAGHIPGAQCRPSADNLRTDGRFKAATVLDAELPAAPEVIAYCGSGVTACHNVLAYAVAGRPLPRLYAGSWSHWIRDPGRPVAIGN